MIRQSGGSVHFLSVAGVIGKMQSRNSENSSHYIVASACHLDDRSLPKVPYRWMTGESGICGRREMVHELEVKHVQY